MLFRAPKELTTREVEILLELEDLKKEVAFSFSPRRWFGSLRRLTAAKAIRASIGIEGFLVSVEDAVAAIEQEEPLDAKDQNRAALFGYREALTLVLQKAEDEHFRYSAEFLNALHFMMVSYDLKAVTQGKDALGEATVHVEVDGKLLTGQASSTDVIEASARAFIRLFKDVFGITPHQYIMKLKLLKMVSIKLQRVF